MKTMMIRRIMLAAVAVWLCMAVAEAKTKTRVWQHPIADYGTHYGDGYFNLAVDVDSVQLDKSETRVHLTFRVRCDDPHHRFCIAGNSYLQADGQRYPVVSASGAELDKQTATNGDNLLGVVLSFNPLPDDVRCFDLVGGDGQNAIQIRGIRPETERWKQLFPSYWRDERTGDWVLALLDSCALYDCRFWDYKTCRVDPKTGEADILMTDGREELQVRVGKNKKGRRQIQVGTQKHTLAMINERFMPDYPVEDARTALDDNGYRADTVTVVGWIKDMPAHYRDKKTFDFVCNDLFSGEQTMTVANLDEKGRFRVKIPVMNSTTFTCDWMRCFIRMPLEPGKTYFMLYDFKEGRRYFMGEDCRLQNELFKYPADWECVRMERGDDFEQYTAQVDRLLKERRAYLDAFRAEHPMLSERFFSYRRAHTLWQQASDYGQSRFACPDYKMPPSGCQYARETFWSRLNLPLTLFRGARSFLTDYVGDAMRHVRVVSTWNSDEHLVEYADNDEQLALLNRWKAAKDALNKAVKAAATEEEKTSIRAEWLKCHADEAQRVNAIVTKEKTDSLMGAQYILTYLQTYKEGLDSLQAPPVVRDVYLTGLLGSHINSTAMPVSRKVMDRFGEMVEHPLCVPYVEQWNNRFIALSRQDFDKLVLKENSRLEGVTDGEKLLSKLLEPFKGKIVLLDVWGTWCAPCKQALSQSQEEYKRLAAYDIAYLYLANNSPQKTWEAVIRQYNVSGPDVDHYNLPRQQQDAIEKYLKVQAYPTYKLFDREGRLLDLKVDARSLDRLESVLKRLSE